MWNSNIKNSTIYITINARISVCLSVCPSIISTTTHLIDFTLGRCIAEDTRKSVERVVVWMRSSHETEKHHPAETESPNSSRPTVLDVRMCKFKRQMKNYISTGGQAIGPFRTGMWWMGTILEAKQSALSEARVEGELHQWYINTKRMYFQPDNHK